MVNRLKDAANSMVSCTKTFGRTLRIPNRNRELIAPIRERLRKNRERVGDVPPRFQNPSSTRCPGQWNLAFDEMLEIEARRLTSFEDGALNVGREEGEAAQGAFVRAGRRAALFCSDAIHSRAHLIDQLLCRAQALDQSPIHFRPSEECRATRSHDPAAAATKFQSNGKNEPDH